MKDDQRHIRILLKPGAPPPDTIRVYNILKQAGVTSDEYCAAFEQGGGALAVEAGALAIEYADSRDGAVADAYRKIVKTSDTIPLKDQLHLFEAGELTPNQLGDEYVAIEPLGRKAIVPSNAAAKMQRLDKGKDEEGNNRTSLIDLNTLGLERRCKTPGDVSLLVRRLNPSVEMGGYEHPNYQ